MRRVLFVCGKNRRRSPTAEAVFSGWEGHEVMSAGTSSDADVPVSGDLLDWADDIVTMESKQSRRLRQQFAARLKDKRLVTLDIRDEYTFMQDELILELRRKAYRWQ